jgi:hypothetical protein
MSVASAYDGFSCEIARFGGGAVVAGAITAIADKCQIADHYQYENCAMIDSGVSTAGMVVAEVFTLATEGGKSSSALLDIASHTLGSALSTMVTDRFTLSPEIREPENINLP